MGIGWGYAVHFYRVSIQRLGRLFDLFMPGKPRKEQKSYRTAMEELYMLEIESGSREKAKRSPKLTLKRSNVASKIPFKPEK